METFYDCSDWGHATKIRPVSDLGSHIKVSKNLNFIQTNSWRPVKCHHKDKTISLNVFLWEFDPHEDIKAHTDRQA